MPLAAKLGVSPEVAALLERYHFAPNQFDSLRKRLQNGEFVAEANRVTGPVSPPGPADIERLPLPEDEEFAEVIGLGSQAIARGQVAVVVLNGGMATRFGGGVKGVVEVVPGKSFLALKIEQIRQVAPKAPIFLMNSFATEGATLSHLGQLNVADVVCASQDISLRLSPDGELFQTASGEISAYAPGHGDVFHAIARSEEFAQFVRAGGKHVVVCNVDNVGADLSLGVVGCHIRGGRLATVEVTERYTEDKGGAPARFANKLQILEGFRFPQNFDIASIPVFNTNTMVLDVSLFHGDHPLTWFRVDKEVEGQPVVQFERLMGEITSFTESLFLRVPREGPQGRFMPVKKPEDLQHVQRLIAD
jgi:UTP--glucose-1-phosphate uridylyltransferase